MLALICALALAASTRWASAATVAEIAKEPAAFDQKTVTVTGTAEEISNRTSRRGNPYTTFRRSDQGEALKVFSFGTLPIKDGDGVEVRAVLQPATHVGPYTFTGPNSEPTPALALNTFDEPPDFPCPQPEYWVPTVPELSEILRLHHEWLGLNAPDEQHDARRANLCKAVFDTDPSLANEISHADLPKAILTNGMLAGIDFSDAFLFRVDFRGANLSMARLTRANLVGARLAFADLGPQAFTAAGPDPGQMYIPQEGANLRGADLSFADLSHANLLNADLEGANLTGAKLLDADLRLANLDAVRFDIDPDSLPNVSQFAQARHIYAVTFQATPVALVRIRDKLREGGLRDQEKEITYAIRRDYTRRAHGWNKYFNLLAFEWPCDYGMSPGRALAILVWLIAVFALIYFGALILAPSMPDSGIWAVWGKERVDITKGTNQPLRLTEGFPPARFSDSRAGRLCRSLRLSTFALAVYFSVLSALRIGWHEFDVGTWIVRMQPREYTLRATGWVRVVSGIQSLTSAYLVGLFILTYFATPFE